MPCSLPPLVIIESPLAPANGRTVVQHQDYARLALKDSLQRGEAPLASHLLYPQVLDDTKPDERTMGIQAGLAWGRAAELTAIYCDLGISQGMRIGIERAQFEGRRTEQRWILPVVCLGCGDNTLHSRAIEQGWHWGTCPGGDPAWLCRDCYAGG